eukprot:jgi/Botrbrau1/17125/Bobra.0157s0026.1
MWACIMQTGHKKDIFELVNLATIFLILLASSAQAESLFSFMNFLKNKSRIRRGRRISSSQDFKKHFGNFLVP